MATRSAGILLYRVADGAPEVLIAHMGGPFWSRKHERAWSIPKGEYGDDEDPLVAAKREFAEELGGGPPGGEPIALGEVTQKNGKVVTVWAVEGDFDASAAVSNTFTLEWPRGSGKLQEFPEVDKADWYDVPTARTLLVAGQVEFLDRLLAAINDAD